ncbi:hypothetical protein NC997_23085 [Trichocoleus sp. DQ-A2]|uniref:hypothetical protein n=1 Tax=Cyanophyceae TaxID=3028117 RepID=UPI0016857F9F|nr:MULTISPECIES: hypothetical protein [unclassified Coleofasciculus]MBD1888450.1 hypothetical protein [Coleofasciculus sp. FACHB-SPT9]MBD2742034.1 hypothetical protein [Coleofasciculus sp. FACHB-1120]
MGTLLGLLFLGAYGYGGWRFWKGFRRTNFSQGRLVLALLWPALIIGNKSYRQNFRKALKG